MRRWGIDVLISFIFPTYRRQRPSYMCIWSEGVIFTAEQMQKPTEEGKQLSGK